MGAGRIRAIKRLVVGGVFAAVLVAIFFSWKPLLVAWHLGRARQALRVRQNDRALDELRAALRIAPDRPETHFLLARAHRRLGNLDQMANFLRRAKSLGGAANRVERETWLALAQSGQLREAEPHLPELLTDPGDDGPDICEAYVQGCFANLLVDQSLELLDAWEKDYPQDAQPHFMRGYLFQGFGLRPESIAAYRRGLQIAPWQSIMRWRLAEVLLEMGELEEAAALLGQCAEENPQNPDVLTSWATCLFRRSEPERARELLEQLLGDSPDHFEARRLLGEIELGQGRFPEALEHLRSAARQRPNDMTTRNALGRVLQVLGRPDEAQGHFDYVVEAERALGRVERQLRLVLKRPDDAELRCQIGTALLKYGSPDDGAKWLRTVLQLQPDHPGAHQALAAYYEARGDWPSARAHRRSRGGK